MTLRTGTFPRRATSLRVTIRFDGNAAGHQLLVLYAQAPDPCPVRALRAWLHVSAITDGAIFRRVTRTGAISSPLTAQSVALIIKRRARAAGLDPADFAGHSLRSGYATKTNASSTATSAPAATPAPSLECSDFAPRHAPIEGAEATVIRPSFYITRDKLDRVLAKIGAQPEPLTLAA